jgi:parallel beta-helix repeat protein
VVLGDINIAEGASLTIEPGVRVELTGRVPNYTDPWGVAINVRGTLIATGVTFTWLEESYQWWGINFNGDASNGSRLENCTIEHASGLYTHCWYGCWVEDQGVIDINSASPTITGCTVDGGQTGISIYNGSPVITNNRITGMSSQGIGVSEPNSSPRVTGNEITGCGLGINVMASAGGTYQGNTINGNTAWGLYYLGNAIIDATNCNWGDSSGLWMIRMTGQLVDCIIRMA